MNLFLFELDKETNEWKQSINWEDDEGAVGFTLARKKDDGSFSYKCGVARIPRAEIDKIRNFPQVEGRLTYNRDVLDDNQYHGNLLLDQAVTKPVRGLIASSLALACSCIIYRNQ